MATPPRKTFPSCPPLPLPFPLPHTQPPPTHTPLPVLTSARAVHSDVLERHIED